MSPHPALPVHVWLPGQPDPVLAGEFNHDAAARTGRFQYAAAYLAAGHPALAPDMPLRRRPVHVTGGLAIFPLFLDAGPDAWGRHLLARRLERDVSEIEALQLCPTDGVGNIALGTLTPERLRVLSVDQFVALLHEVEASGSARSVAEEQVLDATRNGTSLGGTKPKLTIEKDDEQFLAKFPAPGDSPWLPQIECAMLKLARACAIRTCDAEVWHLPASRRAALLVRRFDRGLAVAPSAGPTRHGYVSAQALLRLDLGLPAPADTLSYGTLGYTVSGLRRSYVALAADMARWCGGQAAHREERRELWRRIVFNALIRNLDDHPKNHGLLCADMARQHWRLSPAFDLLPSAVTAEFSALAMAYRYVPPGRRGRQETVSRLVTRIDRADLLAAAVDHYGHAASEAADYLAFAATTVTTHWRAFLAAEGVPEDEMARFVSTFASAARLS